MAKQVTKTPAIIAQMQKIAGDGVDVSNLPVWEAQAVNTLPLHKPGSIYHKAQMSEGMVRQVADDVNANGLPLHTLHQQGAQLPVGRVFMGGTVANDVGLPQTSLMFYVGPDDAQLTSDLDNGIIDSVSIGCVPQCALCSECGFDYLGADSSMANVYDRTCPDGHMLGQDGVHLNLTGQANLNELSLVSKGAAANSKITPGSKSVLSDATNSRLAASGLDPRAVVLQATTSAAFATPKPTVKEPLMADTLQLDGLVDKYTTAKMDLAATAGKLTIADAAVVELTAQVAKLTAANTAFETANADPAGVAAKLTAAEASVEVATTFLRAQATKALTATAGDITKVDAMSVAELTATIDAAQATLSTLFPAGGKTIPAVAGAELSADDHDAAARRNAFKTS